MTINIKLSEESIRGAIARLRAAQDNLRFDVTEFLSELSKEASQIANKAYGSMALAQEFQESETTAIINVVGEIPYIAEFGAGDATMDPMFENYVGVDVYPGSYSEQVGSGEYVEWGRWMFGGQWYTEVEPRMGLLEAKHYILNYGTQLAREVIKL